MLKLSLKPGEYIDIGENVRVIFSGGSANNIHLLVDAPKEIDVTRSSAVKKRTLNTSHYHKESKISKEAQQEIVEILMREKRKAKKESGQL